MAERMVRVCDVCGESATQSVTFKLGGRSLAQDLCDTHARELAARSHAPKRGRKPGSASSSGAGAAPRRRGRPRKSTASAPAAKRTRRKITDPAVLEKRRAALAKARRVRAEKRAAAGATG
jgi:hypothetical protein